MLTTRKGIIRSRKKIYDLYKSKQITKEEYEERDRDLLDMVKDNNAFAEHNIVIREQRKGKKS